VQEGGMIGFVIVEDTIKMEINLNAIKNIWNKMRCSTLPEIAKTSLLK